ncbi:MAG: C-GCAxxG-C-C family protein [Akkermansia sp.]
MDKMSKEEVALRYFSAGYSCAQSVFASFAPELGLDEKVALRLSSGLGAGVGRMREVCGAFTGLSLVLGYFEGNEEGDADQKEHIYALVQAEAARFRAEFGSIICRELLDPTILKDQSTRPQARSTQYYNQRPCQACVAFCAKAASSFLTRE